MPDAASSDTFAAEHRFALLAHGLDAAQLALAAGDLTGALAVYTDLRQAYPESPDPYRLPAVALAARYNRDEADILLEEAAARFPADPVVAAAFADNALERRDIPAALERWGKARSQFPDDPAMAEGLAAALRAASRYIDAEALLRDARTQFAADPGLCAEQARLAFARRDYTMAIARWQAMRRQYPDRIDACAGEAESLIAAGRFDGADSLLAETVARFADDSALLVAQARVATARRDWAEASRRWGIVRARHPDNKVGYLGQAAIWRDLGQFDAADSVLTEALVRFPDDPDTRMAFAAIADSQADSAAAVGRWADARALFPGHAGAHCGGIGALQVAGRLHEAEALARDSMRRFPYRPEPAIAYARLADSRQDWPEANLRWDRAKARFPDAVDAYLGAAHSLREQGNVPAADEALQQAAARFHWLFARDTIAEPEALPLPAIGRDAPIRLTVTGFHLSYQISLLFGRMLPFRDRLKVEWINVGMDLDTVRARLPSAALGATDIHFEESMVGNAATKAGIRAMLPPGADIRTFPTTNLRVLWPFHGPDPRLVPEPPVYNGGRYVDPDRVVASLVDPTLTDDALFDMYMELTEAAPLDLDALYRDDLARLLAEDAGLDVQMASFVADRFHHEMLVAAPHERCTPIVKEVARQLLGTPILREICDLDIALAGLDRLTIGWRAHNRALPVHPRVARHFDLAWWRPDRLYEYGRNNFGFREYLLRYLRWSPLLT